MVSIVVAASDNNVIGKDNQLIWHLPNDLKFFKQQTLGKVIIMGRKTFESIGSKPLPKRTNVVITRNTSFEAPEGVVVFHTLEEALEKYKEEPEVCIVGGEQIYRMALDFTDVVYLTRVHTNIDGDTFFPELDDEWKLKIADKREADERHAYAYTFCTYRKD